MVLNSDTIVAQATPQGRGGVGVVRVSGEGATEIAKRLIGCVPKPRHASLQIFLDREKNQVDEGIALFFKGPNSFTGEDVLELQGHGGPIVMDTLIREIVFAGARLAEPGEFSLRAFLNNKIDLLQAESIADLINARTQQAAKGAMNSLQGFFSKAIEQLVASLLELRVLVESSIDFPDEDVPLVQNQQFSAKLQETLARVREVNTKAQQGTLLSQGLKIVIIGRPNAGKSSLLNVLSGQDAAIVTDIPGTTRDVLREAVSLDGILVELVDTAGLRQASDQIEREGIERAQKEITLAQHLIVVIDGTETTETDPFVLFPELSDKLSSEVCISVLRNKADKTGFSLEMSKKERYTVIEASVKTGQGMDVFRAHLNSTLNSSKSEEGLFLARRRHVEALQHAEETLQSGAEQFKEVCALELLAEDLRRTQQILESITGRVTSDDLLGKIFSEFCIGK